MTGGLKLTLTALANAPSAERNQIHADIVAAYSAAEILDASLEIYDESCREAYLLQAVSLLESKGEEAFPALAKVRGMLE